MIACSASETTTVQLGLVVDTVEQLAHLRLGEKEAPVLVIAPVDRHADVVQERREDDDDLGVVGGQAVVALQRRFAHRASRADGRSLSAMFADDLDVHPGVVVDLEPDDSIHVRDVPPRLDLRIGVDVLEHAAKLAIPARRNAEMHRLDRLGRRQARLGRDVRLRNLDDLFRFRSHRVSLEPSRPLRRYATSAAQSP